MHFHQPYNEKELFLQVAEGDEQAFGIIYDHFLQLMGKGLLALLKSEDALRDVLQESFLRIWLHRDQFTHLENPGGYTRRVISNECFRHLQKQGLKYRQGAAYMKLVSGTDQYSNETEHSLELSETKKLIHQAIGTLSSRQSTIYKMSREQHMKVPEIAKELGLSDDYVKKTLSTSLQKIRQGLLEAGKILPSVLL
ncbi:MAG: sigma-70 family RNA polymerase sigma factor [Chitinophagaceae bacterium]|nr:sigma-70 family RNA polymerase sigma factor [Chitinophagaceae bacterium]